MRVHVLCCTAILGAAWLLPGCSFTFDAQAPAIRLEGAAPPLPRARILWEKTDRFWLIRGSDDAYWLGIFPYSSTDEVPDFIPCNMSYGQTGCPISNQLETGMLRLVRLTLPYADSTIFGDEIRLVNNELQVLLTDYDPTDPDNPVYYNRLTLQRVGDAAPSATFKFPPDKADWDMGERAGYYCPRGGDTFILFRRDGSFSREIASDPSFNLSAWAGEGDFLLAIAACDDNPASCISARSYSTLDERDIDLGVFPGYWSFESSTRRALLRCDQAGLVRVPVDGSPTTTLDSAPCADFSLTDENPLLPAPMAITCGTTGIRQVPLDGGAIVTIDEASCDSVSITGPYTWWSESAEAYRQGFFIFGGGALFELSLDGRSIRKIGEIVENDGVYLMSRGLLTCGIHGLELMSYDDGHPRVLDDSVCATVLNTGERCAYAADGSTICQTLDGNVQYGHTFIDFSTDWWLETPIFAVPLGGGEPPRVLLNTDGPKRLLHATGGAPIYSPGVSGEILFSLDPPDRYVQLEGQEPPSDGWLGNWRFMIRGDQVSASLDEQRLRWRDYTARLEPVGDLFSADLSTKETSLLARNVRMYQEIAPGKLLVADDQPIVGTQNRVILIDEASKTARWIARQTVRFYAPPGDPLHLLVELINDAGEREIAMVNMPQ